MEKLPPIKIIVGKEDPFYDDCWRFMKKLKTAGNDADLYVYEDIRHGILTMTDSIKSGERIISDLCKII